MVCTTRLKRRARTSLSSSARMIGAGKPKAMFVEVDQQRVADHAPEIDVAEELDEVGKPTQGLPRIPRAGEKSLKAIWAP